MRLTQNRSTIYIVLVWLACAAATGASLVLDAPGWVAALAAWTGGLVTGALARLRVDVIDQPDVGQT